MEYEPYEPIDSDPIVDHGLSSDLGMEISTPADLHAWAFQKAVADRDAESLRNLIADFPTVVWGSEFNMLSEEDSAWAMEAVQT